jgi:hypothetical protein
MQDTDPTTRLSWLDRLLLRLFRRAPPWWLFAVPMAVLWIIVLLLPWPAPRTPDDLSAADRARDEAAAVRARAFVEALGFEPGTAVCRSTDSGSAWCTARVAGSDKTFALWCSRRHPTCIENLARQ